MELFPAIDLSDGVAVRLRQGDFSRRRVYGDPLDLARRYAAGGARWIHVVDLDAARTGFPRNRGVVLSVTEAVDVAVQCGGGVRRQEDAAALLDAGVARVVLGTAAVRDPAMVEALARRYPRRVAVGLDHRGAGADVAIGGWEHAGGVTLGQALAHLEGLPLAAVIVTAIERDGTLEGPDLEGLARVLEGYGGDVIASGGVRDGDDLAALARLRGSGRALAGVIVGTALAEGVLGVEEAVAACAASE